jgi:hypothetical protein
MKENTNFRMTEHKRNEYIKEELGMTDINRVRNRLLLAMDRTFGKSSEGQKIPEISKIRWTEVVVVISIKDF